jgi:hypothetical protein
VNLVANDLLIAFISIDTGTAAVTSTGWTELFRTTSTSQLVCMYKISNGTEGDITFAYTTETAVGCLIAIKDVNTTNPFGATPVFNSAASATTAKITMQQITTTIPNSLVLYANGRSAVGIPSFLEGAVTSLFAGDGGAESLAVGWGFQPTAGLTPNNIVSSALAAVAGVRAVIQIAPPSGGATVIPTYCASDLSIYVDPINGTSAYNANTALAATADTGFSTSLGGLVAADATVAAVTDVGINSFHSVGRLTSISASKNLSGAELVLLDANRPNITGKNILVHLGASTEGQLQRFSSVASGRGIWFGVRSGAASNWKIWQVYGAENGIGRHKPVIINSSALNVKSTNGTLDTTLAKAFGFWVSGSGVTTTIWDFASLWVLDTCAVAGGIIAFPMDISGITNAAATGKERKNILQQGEKQALLLSHIQIGNGGTYPVYLNLDGTAIEFPKQYDESIAQASYNSVDNVCGLTYYAGASDVIKHKNSVVSSSSRYKWGLHASSSASASYDFSGLSVIGAGTITLAIAITITELTINNYSTLDISSADLVNCTILNVPSANDSMTSNASTSITGSTINVTGVTAGNRWCSVANPSIFSNSTFIGSGTTGHAIRITTPGTYSLSNLIFTSFGANATNFSAIHNDSGGLVTLNISGGTTPTIRNGAGASTVVNNSVSITIEGNVTLLGAEVRIYDLDNAPAGSLGTELSGTESNVSANYVYSGGAGNLIFIQIMKTGYVEYGQSITIPSSNTTIDIILTKDNNI